MNGTEAFAGRFVFFESLPPFCLDVPIYYDLPPQMLKRQLCKIGDLDFVVSYEVLKLRTKRSEWSKNLNFDFASLSRMSDLILPTLGRVSFKCRERTRRQFTAVGPTELS